MICVNDKKAVICKGDFHPTRLYKGDKKIAGYNVEEFEGENGVTLENCYNDKLHNAQIIGNTVQDGTPTPETPVEVQSVGELVTEGEYAGKYKIPVRARGKNLFKYISGGLYNGSIIEQLPNGAIVKGNLNSNAATTYAYSKGWFSPGATDVTAISPFLKMGDIVTISADITLLEIIAEDGHGIGFALTARDKSAGYNLYPKALNIGETVRLSWTIENTKSDAIYYPVFKLNSNVLRIENIQIELSDTATPCEPYVEPQTFNIYLDEPLRKVGDYADYVDFDEQKVVRNVKNKVFTGEESMTSVGLSSTSNLYRYSMNISDMPNLFAERILRSNYFATGNYIDLRDNTSLTVGIMSTSRIAFSSTIATFPEFKNWIKDLYNSNPLYVCYPLKEPTEEPIDLPELPTFKGTTIYEIATEIPATISGKYKKVEV